MEVDKYINEWKSKKREKLIFGLVRWLYCEACVQCTIKCIWTGCKTSSWYNCNLSEQEWRMQRSAFIHLLKGKEKKLKKLYNLYIWFFEMTECKLFLYFIFSNYLKNLLLDFFSSSRKFCSSRENNLHWA